MSVFPLTISSVDETYFEGDATSVTVPGSEGELTILRNHEQFVSVLKEGSIVVRCGEEIKTFRVDHGILEVHRNGAVILL